MDFVTHIVKYNNSTNGRDKLCRVFQYGSKFGWWFCDISGKDPELVLKLKNLESALSATRKVLRFGKSLDLLQGALKSVHLSDTVLRLTITLSKINQACYLLLDHVVWMGKVGLMKVDTKKYSMMAARFWLVTLIFNLTRNLYDIYNILTAEIERRAKKKEQYSSNGGVSSSVSRPYKHQELLKQCVVENKPVFVDTLKNATDLTLPMAVLGYWNTSPGFQGIMGVISSLAGMAVAWNATLKLVP